MFKFNYSNKHGGFSTAGGMNKRVRRVMKKGRRRIRVQKKFMRIFGGR